MPKLPRVTGKELIAALRKTGFEVIRVCGSHSFLGLLSKILRDCELSVDELGALLQRTARSCWAIDLIGGSVTS